LLHPRTMLLLNCLKIHPYGGRHCLYAPVSVESRRETRAYAYL
jgi:hypothetical protein